MMLHSKSVTVIIPVYNGAEFLEDTLNSVVNQTFRDWNCLIIDDGSTDNSLEVMREFIRLHKSMDFSIQSITNQGPGVARNVGIANSNSPFIALLDQDDLWDQDKLELQVDFLKRNPEHIGVLCDFQISRVLGNGHLVPSRTIKNRKLEQLSRNWISLEGNGAFISSCLLFRGNLGLDQVMFNPNYSHVADLDFYLRFEACGSVGYLQRNLVTYRQHSKQMHNDSNGLKIEYPSFISSLDLTAYRLKENRLLGNMHVMAALLEIRSGAFGIAITDIVKAFRSSPISLLLLPLSVLRKRIVGFFNALLNRPTR